MNDVVNIITTVGFPIAMCLGMMWYVKYITDQHRIDRLESDKMHKEAIAQVTEALNNNTLVLQKLCTLVGKEDE